MNNIFLQEVKFFTLAKILILLFSDKTVAVRLEGPSSKNGTGRVHVFYNGVWGVMSRYGLDMNDAKVVCRELGYEYAIRAFRVYYYYHFYFSRFCLNDVICTGKEQRFSDCSYGRWTNSYYCWHFYDLAGVECSSTGDLTTMFYMYNQISKFKTRYLIDDYNLPMLSFTRLFAKKDQYRKF